MRLDLQVLYQHTCDKDTRWYKCHSNTQSHCKSLAVVLGLLVIIMWAYQPGECVCCNAFQCVLMYYTCMRGSRWHSGRPNAQPCGSNA